MGSSRCDLLERSVFKMSAMWFLLACVVQVCTAFTLKREVQLKALSADTLDINMCYFCEGYCAEYIERNYGMDPTAFATAMTAQVETNLRTLHDNFRLNMTIVGQFASKLRMTQFLGGAEASNAVDRMTVADENLWSQVFASFVAQGCDVAFSLVDSADPIFDGGVSGIARLNTICGDSSYGMVSLFSSISMTAELVSHEFGHVLGLSHDDRLMDLDQIIKDQFPEMWSTVLSECDGVTGHHIMNPLAVGTDKLYSDCSRAYFALYLAGGIWNSHFYDISCANKDVAEKRQLGELPVITDDLFADAADVTEDTLPATLPPLFSGNDVVSKRKIVVE